MEVESRGISSGGARRREQFYRRRRPRGRTHDHRLRATIRRGVKSRVQYSGFRLGARVYVDPSVLPQSQRKLPRHLNDEHGWRHPVYRRRTRRGKLVDVWVRQTGSPYFTRTIERHKARVIPAVEHAVEHALRQLERR